MSTIAEILADVSAFGFSWSLEPVRTDNGRDVLGMAPIMVVTEITKFALGFPGKIEACLDGSSVRVISQRITRDMLKKNRRVSVAEMQQAVVSGILGIRTRASLPADYADYLAWKAMQEK
jgi:hypothetical protein